MLTFKSFLSLSKTHVFNGYLCIADTNQDHVISFFRSLYFAPSPDLAPIWLSFITIMFTCILSWHCNLGRCRCCYICCRFVLPLIIIAFKIMLQSPPICICVFIKLCVSDESDGTFTDETYMLPYCYYTRLLLYWMWNAVIRLRNPSCLPKLNNFSECLCTQCVAHTHTHTVCTRTILQFNFRSNRNDKAIKRLLNVVGAGGRCGCDWTLKMLGNVCMYMSLRSDIEQAYS